MVDWRRTPQRQRSRSTSLPAPVGGLNGRDSIAAMAPKDAYYMNNWFPGTATVDARNGSSVLVDDLGDPVETLAVYTGGTSAKMLAFLSGTILDVTGGASTSLQTGRTGNQIVYTMFSNAGNHFMIGCSGLDVPFSYEGATVANLTMTSAEAGFNPALLQFVMAFKGRLFFAHTGFLGFFYLPVGQIQGAMDYYDLSQVAKLGGSITAMSTFSLVDAGTGPQDYCLFITSEGEYLVYGGFNPDSAADWGIVGRYYAAAPIGRNCAMNFGTDVMILTLEGALPLSEIRRVLDANDERNAVTAKLGSFLSDLNVNADVYGWNALLYPRGGMMILNVPVSASIAGEYEQFVMNTNTGAWTRFTGWNGICFAVFGRRLYFGTYDGKVMLADEGHDDNGEDIRLECKQAYNIFDDGYGSGDSNKLFHFARLTVASEGAPALSGELSVDFAEDQPDYATPLAPGGGDLWDVALWDLAAWESGIRTQYVVISLGKYGIAASLWLRTSLNGTGLKWYTTKFIYEKAAGLL